jgi:hypothetical protein
MVGTSPGAHSRDPLALPTLRPLHLTHRHSGVRLLGAGPESILTMVVMDSGFAPIGPRFARTGWRAPE